MVRYQWPDGKRKKATSVVFVLAALCASAALSGCVADEVGFGGDDKKKGSGKDGDGSGGGPGGEGGAGGGSGSAGSTQPYRFLVDDARTRYLNETGSFSATEFCFPVNCIIGDDSNTARVDLSGIMEVGVPMRVNVSLSTDAEMFGQLSGYLQGEGAVGIPPGGSLTQIEDVIVALPDSDARLYFVVSAFVPDSADGHTWWMRAEAVPVVDRVPAGMPVAFQVDDPAAHPVVRSTNATAGKFMLFGPDDAYLGYLRTDMNQTAAFEKSGMAGEYVLFAPWDEGDLVVHGSRPADSEDGPEDGPAPPAMRVLTLSETWGDLQGTLPQDPAEWSFDLDRVPLALGMVLYTENGRTEISSGITLSSPAGTVIDQELCGTCSSFLGHSTRYFWVEGRETNVVPGSYDASYRDDGYGTSAAHAVWNYER